jgi:transketolase
MDLEQLSINTIRTLAIDGVQKANSGHPGAPLGLAPLAYVLWTKFLRHNPTNPRWPGRDRFVLSPGHASMLIYTLLYLSGYGLTLEDLKQFRQWGSKTPGHPEYGHTAGLEMTTGPLGQGAGSSVGMAMAEAHLAATYNRPGFPLFDNHTYAIVSDGDLMEGISHEAASLAGHLRLGKLIWLYDDNQVSLDAATAVTFTDDTEQRFAGYGWRVLSVTDGNDTAAIAQALTQAKADSSRPTLIRVRTVIGYGSPHKAGTSKAHGEALGAEEVVLTKQALGWPYPEPFTVPDTALAHFREALPRGEQLESKWNALLAAYQAAHPQAYAELSALLAGELPAGWEQKLPTFEEGSKLATRAASGQVISTLGAALKPLLGGSADLSGSTKTTIAGEPFLGPEDYRGRNLYFGVREHGMAAAANGLALYAPLRPFVGTFLIFSDYLKPSLRLSSLMHLPVIYIFTHDSIGLGEDGPTHQPVEQLAALRATPGVVLLRPADANETAAAWRIALERSDGPTALVLTRQDLPTLPAKLEGVRKGAYLVADPAKPVLTLMASGSEVSLALSAAELLAQRGQPARVVSMPSMELFRQQDPAYQRSILDPELPRIAIEAASPQSWYEWLGGRGEVLALSHFGASAPAKILFEKFGFTPERVVELASRLLG